MSRSFGVSKPICLVVFLMIGGCITPHSYQDVTPMLNVAGAGRVTVATHDERPYIVSGGTSPTFVGLVRSAMGVPWAVHTESSRPLADEITEIITRAFRRNGFQCRAVFVPASMGRDEVRQKLQEDSDAIALLVVLHEWKSDTHTDTALAYDLSLSVWDSYGIVPVEAHTQGRDVLGEVSISNALSPRGMNFAAAAVPQVLQKKLEDLLNTSSIVAALQTHQRSAVKHN